MNYFLILTNLAGCPATIEFGFTSCVTNEYVATTEFYPIVTPGKIVA